MYRPGAPNVKVAKQEMQGRAGEVGRTGLVGDHPLPDACRQGGCWMMLEGTRGGEGLPSLISPGMLESNCLFDGFHS